MPAHLDNAFNGLVCLQRNVSHLLGIFTPDCHYITTFYDSMPGPLARPGLIDLAVISVNDCAEDNSYNIISDVVQTSSPATSHLKNQNCSTTTKRMQVENVQTQRMHQWLSDLIIIISNTCSSSHADGKKRNK